MKKRLILIIAFCILMFTLLLVFRSSLFSGKEPAIKYFKIKKERILREGEWISDLDSLSGISIRENKIAFFKNMEFTSDDIYEYIIIDSVYKNKESEHKIGEYLMMKDFSDTIYYQIINKNDSSLTLKINKTETETFNLKVK